MVSWFLPLVFFFVCLGITIYEMQGNYLRNADGNDFLSRNFIAKKRALFMIIIMALQFFVLTSPTNIMEVIFQFLPWNATAVKAIPWLSCLTFVNCCIKPIVYAVMRPNFEERQYRDGEEAVQPAPDAPLIDDGATAETCH